MHLLYVNPSFCSYGDSKSHTNVYALHTNGTECIDIQTAVMICCHDIVTFDHFMDTYIIQWATYLLESVL